MEVITMTYYIGFHQNTSPFSKFIIVATTKSNSIANFIVRQYNKCATERNIKVTYRVYRADQCTEFPIEFMEE